MNKYPTYKPSGIRWIGEIPVHWEVKRLKDVAEVKFSSIDKHSYDDEESVKLCNYVDVYKNEFINSSISFMNGSASESEYDKLKLKKGDVLVTKDSETPQDIAVPAFVNEDLNNVVCGYHLALIRPHNKIAGSYLFRLFQTKPLNAHFEVSANGITRYGLGVDSFTNLHVFIPPIQEQLTIASYLYEQTQMIDNLIANKTTQLERLRELRQIEINNAVTKGMNPNTPLKDSGIEWLGEIPEHWEVKRLKNSVYINKNILSESTNPDYVIQYIDISNVTSGGELIEIQEMPFSEAPSRARRKVKDKDIILSTVRSYLRAIAFIQKAADNLIASTGFAVITVNENRLIPQFLFFQTISHLFISGVISNSEGVSYPAISSTELGDLNILIPPRDEQLQIANHLQQRTSAIDKLIKNTNAQIEKLQELRKISIYEAVTGKVKCHA